MTWATLPTGETVVNGSAPTLAPGDRAAFDTRVWRWRALALELGAKYQVPAHWLLGMIWRESSGVPTALSRDGGVGLMQLTSSDAKGGYADAQLLDPRLNVELGARYVARIVRPGDQLPEVASKYNAGQTADGRPHAGPGPFGMRETPGHIAAVVAAANYAAGRLRASFERGEGGGAPKDPLSGLGPLLTAITLMRWLT